MKIQCLKFAVRVHSITLLLVHANYFGSMVIWLILLSVCPVFHHKITFQKWWSLFLPPKASAQSLLALCRAGRRLYMTIQSNKICLFINKFRFEFVNAQWKQGKLEHAALLLCGSGSVCGNNPPDRRTVWQKWNWGNFTNIHLATSTRWMNSILLVSPLILVLYESVSPVFIQNQHFSMNTGDTGSF